MTTFETNIATTEPVTTGRRFARFIHAWRRITIPSPRAWMRAHEQLDRFKKLDERLLRDAGLLQADIDRMKAGDFLNWPKRDPNV